MLINVVIHKIKYYHLQIRCIKLHIAHLFNNYFLDLVAVLLDLVLALLHWFVDASQTLLHVTEGLDGFLLALVADLPGLLLAVLGVAVLLGLLWTSLHLHLANLFGLEVAVLFLNWEGEDVGELFAISMDIGLAYLDLDLSRNVIAILLRGPRTHHLLLSISVVLCRLLPLAVKLDSIGAGDVVDCFFLHVAIGRLHVAALVVILGGGVNIVSGVAHPVLPCEAPLDLVSLLKSLVMDSLHEVTDQLVHIKADALNIGLNDPGAVLEQLRLASLLVLCPAGLLGVGLALVLEDDLLHLVAVGVLIDAVTPNIGLANVWIIILNWRWCWVLRWRGWWRCRRIRWSLTVHIGQTGGKENDNEDWKHLYLDTT